MLLGVCPDGCRPDETYLGRAPTAGMRRGSSTVRAPCASTASTWRPSSRPSSTAASPAAPSRAPPIPRVCVRRGLRWRRPGRRLSSASRRCRRGRSTSRSQASGRSRKRCATSSWPPTPRPGVSPPANLISVTSGMSNPAAALLTTVEHQSHESGHILDGRTHQNESAERAPITRRRAWERCGHHVGPTSRFEALGTHDLDTRRDEAVQEERTTRSRAGGSADPVPGTWRSVVAARPHLGMECVAPRVSTARGGTDPVGRSPRLTADSNVCSNSGER